MVKKIGSFRRKTRHKLRKSIRTHGKISLTNYFQKFEVGDKVALVAEPAVQKGMFHPKYYGNIGVITGKQGRCYTILIHDRTKAKVLIAHPVHLKRL